MIETAPENQATRHGERGLRGLYARSLRRARRYASDEAGVVALEFAFLAIPFLMLLFAILELAVVFFVASALDHSTAVAARQIRTGEMQLDSSNSGADQQLAAFRAKVCENMATFKGCDQRLRVRMVVANDGRFRPNMIPAGEGTLSDTEKADKAKSPSTFKPGDSFSVSCGGQVVVLKTEYYHSLTINSVFTRLSNYEGNRRILRSATAFRNEPFPMPTGGCGTGI